jgi:hypothetical protein
VTLRFKNKSEIKTTVSAGNTRGERSNFIECMCYDTETDDFTMARIDLRKPFTRYIPEWVVLEEEMKMQM